MSALSKPRILMMAAGTGGHIIPALTVAECLKEKADIHWLGTPHGLEQQLVKSFPLHTIPAQGLRGKSIGDFMQGSFKMIAALSRAYQWMRHLKPKAVLGFGGYVAVPGGLAAKLCGVPLFIHEQNSRAGLGNRLLSTFSKQIFEAFPHTFKQAVTTGNPVREAVGSISPLSKIRNPIQILVLGGSQGAKVFNELMPKAFSQWKGLPVKIWHIAGAKNVAETEALYQKLNFSARVSGFVEEMAEAYEWADWVIARAGALTVSELIASKRPSLLIPLPHAADNHQFFNARYLADNQGALLIEQKSLTVEILIQAMHAMLDYPLNLISMSQRLAALPVTNATQRICEAMDPFLF